MTDPWQQAFARFLDAAGPYLDQLVVAGGWASRLYRLTDRAIESDFVPLLTRDVDAVIPDRMPARERGLNELMVASNFTEEPSSEFTPPITYYVLDEPKGFEVEFLTNLPCLLCLVSRGLAHPRSASTLPFLGQVGSEWPKIGPRPRL